MLTANSTDPADPTTDSDEFRRAELIKLLNTMNAWDETEQGHLETVQNWIMSGAPLWRVQKPDVPPMHLVSYFVILDKAHQKLLLVAHRKAGLWLPSGGHVEPLEDPWDTVSRECQEELYIEAVAAANFGQRPFFLTATKTRGEHSHTDVSLWYVLEADPTEITSYDVEEFSGIRWLSFQDVLDQPLDLFDPHMHRFTYKLIAKLATV